MLFLVGCMNMVAVVGLAHRVLFSSPGQKLHPELRYATPPLTLEACLRMILTVNLRLQSQIRNRL